MDHNVINDVKRLAYEVLKDEHIMTEENFNFMDAENMDSVNRVAILVANGTNTLPMGAEHNLLTGTLFAFATALGFALALILFAGWDIAKETIVNYQTAGLLAVLVLAMRFYKKSAIFYIILSAIAGLLLHI